MDIQRHAAFVKLSFGYPRPDDAWSAFCAVVDAHSSAEPASNSVPAAKVRGPQELTFGDFIAATRGLGLARGTLRAELMLDAIAEEVRLKSSSRKSIGFAAA